MKRTLTVFALFIGLLAPHLAHAYGNNQDVEMTVDLNYDSGLYDDWIFNHDPNTIAQTKCPKLTFFPSSGLQVSSWATGQSYGPAPGQSPFNGQMILKHCYYTVRFSIPAYTYYSIDVYPVCSGTPANIPYDYRLGRVTGNAGNNFSGTQYLSATQSGPFYRKSYWRGVISQCGGNTNYYDTTASINFNYNGVNYYSAWY